MGGSYSSRSIIASAQRCINYYPEVNPKSAIVPMTHYQRPGLVPLIMVGAGPIRGLHRASTTLGFVVSGNQVFTINSNNNTALVGTLGTSSGPVQITDNGLQVVFADGGSTNYYCNVDGSGFAALSDPSGNFLGGAMTTDYLDTYIFFDQPGSPYFNTTLSNSIGFDQVDPFFKNAKVAYPDNITAVYVNRRELFLFGDVKTEIWYDSGPTTTTYPFSILPGTYIEHGLSARYSIAAHDINVFWLSRDLEGEGVVLQFRGYLTERISNHALEDAIRKMQKTVGITDAKGFSYQMDGHWFYMLTFPAGDQTWVYDRMVQDPTAAWHQECWTDPSTGNLHRHRANCMAFINGYLMVGDWENNTIYYMDMDTYTDTVAGVTCPITCIRSLPHLGQGRLAGSNNMVEVDGRRLQFSSFRADIESGMASSDFAGNTPPQITLRWSDDRGRTFGTDVLQSNGNFGEYLTQPQWLGMGIARDRIFEIQHNIMGPAAFNGAWVDAEVAGT